LLCYTNLGLGVASKGNGMGVGFANWVGFLILKNLGFLAAQPRIRNLGMGSYARTGMGNPSNPKDNNFPKGRTTQSQPISTVLLIAPFFGER